MWVQLGRHSDPPRNANSATDPPLLHICFFLSYEEKSFLWDWIFLSGGTIVCLGYSKPLKTLTKTIVLFVFVFHWHWICVLYISVCIFGLSHFRMQVTQCGRPSYALIWTFWIPLPTLDTLKHFAICCPHSPLGPNLECSSESQNTNLYKCDACHTFANTNI